MPTTSTKTLAASAQLGDLVRSIFNPGYNYISSTIVSPAGAVATPNVRLLGQPVKVSGGNHILVLAADIANATGIIADDGFFDLPVAAGTLTNVTVLKRGPAIVHADALPALDVNGGAINAANFQAALAGLPAPIVTQTAFAQTKTQTN